MNIVKHPAHTGVKVGHYGKGKRDKKRGDDNGTRRFNPF